MLPIWPRRHCSSCYLEKRTVHYWCIRQQITTPHLQQLQARVMELTSVYFSFPWWKIPVNLSHLCPFANLTDPPDFSFPENCFWYSCSGLQYLKCGNSTSGYTRKKGIIEELKATQYKWIDSASMLLHQNTISKGEFIHWGCILCLIVTTCCGSTFRLSNSSIVL